ncbi:galactose-3-O-sulfotransferase 3-like [Ylistrum balloti]|uniref:galactose-3-O-sulfotransferase 3-like n=1 Tax=Ylistrum balloti TaxID=509963 RepID=UPI002905E978|nr:galactose-3-O-sulfotransferase 3-like [Ylistrum balloti]
MARLFLITSEFGVLACLLLMAMMTIFQIHHYKTSVSHGENHWEHFSWRTRNTSKQGHVRRHGIDINNYGESKRHIAFLKVHKAASSTAQNIFLRYANRRDLVVVMPHVPKFFYPNIISTGSTVTSKNILPPPANRSYEILCCHVLYNREAFVKIMPIDTIYIGIIREPFEHFTSILNYFRPGEILNINDTMAVSKYLQEPSRYTKRTSNSYANNRMAREFGFPSDLFTTHNKTEVQLYLQKLESEFELMIIVEQFDECMVLMRRLLNWKLSDILYIKKNVKHKLFEKIKFTAGDVNLYKRWAVLDYALYDHFYQRLQNQIRMQGPDFYDELLYFKRMRHDMEFFCNPMLGAKGTTIHQFAASRWNPAFVITEKDCHYMHIGETAFIKEIRLKQYGFFNDRPGEDENNRTKAGNKTEE